ncbi:MAG: CD1108 family mobile element protein, partial [Candidatus Ventricola sp.]
MTETRNRSSPRLRFSKEELANPELAQKAEKAEKAADRYDIAKKKLQKHRLKLTAEEVQTEQVAMQQSDADTAELHEPAAPSPEPSRQKKQAAKGGRSPAGANPSGKAPAPTFPAPQAVAEAGNASAPHARKKKLRLRFEETEAKPPSRLRHPVQRPIESAHDQLHQQLAEANEDDNAAASAVLQGDRLSTSALQMGEHAYHAHKLRPYKQAQRAERALDQANLRYLEARRRAENPQFTSNPLSRWQQKRAIRKEYAAMKAAGNAVGDAGKSAAATGKTVRGANDVAGRVAEVFQSHPSSLLIILLCAMLLILMGSLQSCTPLAQSVLESLIIGTYPATEDDVRAAERAYAAKERELQDEMDRYEQYHPGYDEYHVDADEIWHDPYVLIAIISAYFDGQDWTLDTAYPVIEKYFDLQYIVTQTVSTETRYRTETRTGTRIVTDPVTGQQHTETYTYD